MTLPRWLGRIVYALRGKRKARFHLQGPGVDTTLEGVYVGRWAGSYVVILPKLVEAAGRTVSMEGYLEIPVDRVAFVQILP